MDSSVDVSVALKRCEQNESPAGLDANEAYICRQIANLPRGWSHSRDKQNRYVILANAKRAFSKEIEKELAGIYPFFEKSFPGEPRVKWTPIVRLFANRNEYSGYGGPAGSAGPRRSVASVI